MRALLLSGFLLLVALFLDDSMAWQCQWFVPVISEGVPLNGGPGPLYPLVGEGLGAVVVSGVELTWMLTSGCGWPVSFSLCGHLGVQGTGRLCRCPSLLAAGLGLGGGVLAGVLESACPRQHLCLLLT